MIEKRNEEIRKEFRKYQREAVLALGKIHQITRERIRQIINFQ